MSHGSSQSKERAGVRGSMTRTTTNAHRGRGGRRDRHRRQRERRCVLLAVVGVGCARVPRPDDRAPDPRSGGGAGSAARSRSRPRWARSRVWVALSTIWSISASASVREVERMLVYVAVALAVSARPAARRRARCPRRSAARHRPRLVVRARHAALSGSIRRLRSTRSTRPARGAPRVLERLRTAVRDGRDSRGRSRRPRRGARRSRSSREQRFPLFVDRSLLRLLARILDRPVLRARRSGRARSAPHHRFSGRCSSLASAVGRRCRRTPSRQDALTTDGVPAADAAREGTASRGSSRRSIVGSAVLAWVAHSVAGGSPTTPRVRRGVSVALAAVRRRAVVVVAVAAVGGPACAVDGASRSLRGRACGRSRSQRSAVQRLGHGPSRHDPRRLGRRPRSSRRRHRCRHVRDPLVRSTGRSAR